jgi:5'-3' exonuclease
MKIDLIKRVFKKRLGYILIQDKDHYCLYDKNLTVIKYFLSKRELFQYTKMLKKLGILRR